MNSKIIVLALMFLSLFSCNKDEKEQDENVIDLFILAGQSNAQGRQGDAANYPADPNGLDEQIMFNWTKIDDTSSGVWVTMGAQEGNFPNGHFGLEVSLSRKLLQSGYKPAIFKYTKTATSIFEHWRGPGDGGFYDAMIIDLNQAISDLEEKGFSVNIRSFIWIQGESDSNSEASANAYATNLHNIITDIRSVTKNEHLPIILGVDEQFFDLDGHQQPQILNAHQDEALNDENIMFSSMYRFPKADLTHLTPEGLILHGESIFNIFQLLSSNEKPSANCTLASGGVRISTLTKKSWGQSFNTNCSGYLSSISFSAASELDNSATITIHNGMDCSGQILFSQSIDAISLGENTINTPVEFYIDKEHTYYLNITSNTNIGWKVNFSDDDVETIGNLKTNRNNQLDTMCSWSFLNFDLNFSIKLKQ